MNAIELFALGQVSPSVLLDGPDSDSQQRGKDEDPQEVAIAT